MTIDELIEEGRRIQRRTILLAPDGTGDPVAIWFGVDFEEEPADGHRCWLTVDAKAIPFCDLPGWLSIFTQDESNQGRVDVSPSPPKTDGVHLYAREIVVLPPIDAVFAKGSPAVDRWLDENNWKGDWGYNSNFRDRAIVEKYEAVAQRENPLYWKGAYATLGGWHMGWPEDDWHDLLDAKLLVQTYMDSEPWVEAWQLPSGELKVIQRIT